MGGLWFVLAAVCVVAGLALLWWDRRRRRDTDHRPAPAPPPPERQPGDLFREADPR